MGRDTLGRPRHRLEQYVKMEFGRGEGPPRAVMPEERDGGRRGRRRRRRRIKRRRRRRKRKRTLRE